MHSKNRSSCSQPPVAIDRPVRPLEDVPVIQFNSNRKREESKSGLMSYPGGDFNQQRILQSYGHLHHVNSNDNNKTSFDVYGYKVAVLCLICLMLVSAWCGGASLLPVLTFFSLVVWQCLHTQATGCSALNLQCRNSCQAQKARTIAFSSFPIQTNLLTRSL